MSIVHLDGTTDVAKPLLGGKAWSIQRMLAMGIPVPPAFAITTDECARYYDAGRQLPDDLEQALPAAVAWLQERTGKTFGAGDFPLLVSVRSGAIQSMPGMMDTVLNLGMDDAVQRALAARTGDEAFAADTRRRFEEQFAHVAGTPAPADPWEQLHAAVAAVFDSWQSDRAVTYRRERGIDATGGGTAVTVQAMVFGNLGDESGTGVLFTRNPLTGAADVFGEWLPRGQGEDVVSGRHDPLHLDDLAQRAPAVHEELMAASGRLEQDSADCMDIEFTIEAGKLWLLQSRVAKRSPDAAVRLAVAFEHEGLIDRGQALDRVDPDQAAAVLREHVDPVARAAAEVLASGKPACPGLSRGVIVTDSDEAAIRAQDGEDVILTRPTTDPNDVRAMAVVAGVLTEMGGATSHAAVVSRELGVPCVVGCGEGVLMALAGREVTLDAATGEVLAGVVPVTKSTEEDEPAVALLSHWAREEAGGQDTGASLPRLLKQRRDAQTPGRT